MGDEIANQYRSRLNIEDEHDLVTLDHKRDLRHGMDNDDYLFEECGPDGELIARYEVWHHMSIYPPQATNAGYRRLNPAGDVTCEGKL